MLWIKVQKARDKDRLDCLLTSQVSQLQNEQVGLSRWFQTLAAYQNPIKLSLACLYPKDSDLIHPRQSLNSIDFYKLFIKV